MFESFKEHMYDAFAFSRAVDKNDFDAAEVIWNSHPNKLDIAMPQATVIASLVQRLEEELGLSGEVIWGMLIGAVEDMEIESPEDGE